MDFKLRTIDILVDIIVVMFYHFPILGLDMSLRPGMNTDLCGGKADTQIVSEPKPMILRGLKLLTIPTMPWVPY